MSEINQSDGYQDLVEYLKGEGSERVLKHLKEMSDSAFLTKFMYLAELAIPKLQRADSNSTKQAAEIDKIKVEIK